MYSILDFSKVGEIKLQNGSATVSGFPNYDTDKIHNPNVPILVMNLKIDNNGIKSAYSGFAYYSMTDETDDWYLGPVKFTSGISGKIYMRVS